MKNQYLKFEGSRNIDHNLMLLVDGRFNEVLNRTLNYSRVDKPTISNYNDHLDRAGVGFWRFNGERKQLDLCTVSRKMTQLMNHQNLYRVIKCLHQLTRKSFLLNIKRLAETGNGFEQEAHLILANGESRWFRVAGILEQSSDGFYEVSGTLVDITSFKLDEIKRVDLMSFMAHELRTPLSSLKLYVQLSSKFLGQKNAAFIRHQLSKADEQASVINKLVERYLNLSIAEHASTDIQNEIFDFSELVYQTVSDFAQVSPDHVFKMEICGSLFMKGNRERIKQVMNNFISNAVKFSPKNSFIKVSCKNTEKGTEFSVLDQGIGIPEEQQQNLFTKYFRASHNRTGAIKGCGLGLYLSKEIISAHYGEVFFESKPNLGSIFGFVIPLATTA